jgi:methionine-rich copper-binding protein CopC
MKGTNMRYARTLIGTMAGLVLCMASPAFAHASLVKSDPSAGSTVAPPKTIVLTFSEKVVPAFTGFSLTMNEGIKHAFAAKMSADEKKFTLTPSGSLMKGTYKLVWHAAAADDGHRTDGTLSFKVK